MHTAEEEAGSSNWGQQPAAGLVDAYMTLVDFCDQQLRQEEETASGESQKKKKVVPHYVNVKS